MSKSPYEGGPAGDAASREGLANLRTQLASLKATKAALVHLKKGLSYANERKFEAAGLAAKRAIKLDPNIVYGWHLLGIALDKQDDRPGALDAYERALALDPESPQIANDLGRLAYRMEMWPQAEALFRHCLLRRHASPEASNNLAALYRRQMRYEEAIEVLRLALTVDPNQPLLWVTLGTIMGDQGKFEEAETFYLEALRLDPNDAKALYNITGIMFSRGEEQEAIDQCMRALPLATAPEHATMMRFSIGTMSLSRGDLPQGWNYYAARLEPTFTEPVHFLANRPRWEPGMDIAGRHLMLYGEQGLGDEVLFANVLEDVLADLGPSGRMTFAITDRLLPLFKRSFPQITLGAHLTFGKEGKRYRTAPFMQDWADVDYWIPVGELLKGYRADVGSFPNRPEGFMLADPKRVEHWRGILSELPGMKVGLLWTSLVVDNNRSVNFSPFEQWKPILRTPGVTFVNLQYGDRTEELDFARRNFGVEIFQPEGIDLKNDLDDVAALSKAMDLVLGISNATFNMAAAVGAPTWLLTAPRSWTSLGTKTYPWYSQVRRFAPAKAGEWGDAMDEIALALAKHARGGTRLTAAG